ncbi:MAG: hypothetical protein UY04_C0010G0024 [Parcubacteria group bacterium GW2011_GWA2_47_7]|nr:MAG: hypothetical protein UY04_C0010G0024 [Parcubacteria group bacterium GW2011_GWA2_47_7]
MEPNARRQVDDVRKAYAVYGVELTTQPTRQVGSFC